MMQTIRFILLFIVAGWMGLLVWRAVIKGLQGGTILYGRKICDRKETPVLYWSVVFAYAVFWTLLCVVAWTRLMEK